MRLIVRSFALVALMWWAPYTYADTCLDYGADGTTCVAFSDEYGLEAKDPILWARIKQGYDEMCGELGEGSSYFVEEQRSVSAPDAQVDYTVVYSCLNGTTAYFLGFVPVVQQIDLKIRNLTMVQNGLNILGNEVAWGPATITVSISADPLSYETAANPTLTLAVGSHVYQTSVDLANLRNVMYQDFTFQINFDEDDGVQQDIVATINGDHAVEEVSYLNNSETWSVNLPSQKIVIQPLNIVLAQTVYNPALGINSTGSPAELQAILDKSASFKVGLKTEIPPGQVYPGGTIDVDVYANGSLISIAKGIRPDKTTTIEANQFSAFIPSSLDPVSLEVRVDASQVKGAVKTIPLTGIVLRSFKTYPVTVGLIRFGDCRAPLSCYGAVSDAKFAAQVQTQKFTSDVFPVPDQGLRYKVSSEIFNGRAGKNLKLTHDTLALVIKKLLLNVNKIVGVVPSNYFSYITGDPHDDTVGITLRNAGGGNGNVSLVSENAGQFTIAHELYHSFGVHGEMYGLDSNGNVVYTGPLISGYNARTGDKYENVESLMGGALTNVWADRLNYGLVAQTLMSPPSDPPVAIIAGIINSNSTASFDSMYWVHDGVLSLSSTTGNAQIRTVDKSGKYLNSLSFQIDTTAIVTSASPKLNSTIELGAMPFAVALPFSDQIAYVEIVVNGIVRARASSSEILVAGILNSIPLAEYNSFRSCARLSGSAQMKCEANVQRTMVAEQDFLLKLGSQVKKDLADNSKKSPASIMRLIAALKSVTDRHFVAADESQLSQEEAVSQLTQIAESIKVKGPVKCHWKNWR